MSHETRARIVVGARGQDARARLAARALLMSGREVVFVGGGQSIDQLARTAVAEDAGAVVVDGSTEDLTRLRATLAQIGLSRVECSLVDTPDVTDPTPHKTA